MTKHINVPRGTNPEIRYEQGRQKSLLNIL